MIGSPACEASGLRARVRLLARSLASVANARTVCIKQLNICRNIPLISFHGCASSSEIDLTAAPQRRAQFLRSRETSGLGVRVASLAAGSGRPRAIHERNSGLRPLAPLLPWRRGSSGWECRSYQALLRSVRNDPSARARTCRHEASTGEWLLASLAGEISYRGCCNPSESRRAVRTPAKHPGLGDGSPVNSPRTYRSCRPARHSVPQPASHIHRECRSRSVPKTSSRLSRWKDCRSRKRSARDWIPTPEPRSGNRSRRTGIRRSA